MVNVDLLIQDEKGRTLLAWRDDPYCGLGWHVPGGIIRFKENWLTRVREVAKKEIGAEISCRDKPLAFHQVIIDQSTRGHFISILYKCFLSSKFVPKNEGLSAREPGYLKWHRSCPENLLEVQAMYRKYIQEAAHVDS